METQTPGKAQTNLLIVNPGKKLTVKTENGSYNRYAIKTHFIGIGEDLGKLIESYVLPFYKPDDIVTISEKIVSLCQKQVVYKKDMTLSPLAKFLSKFASTSSTGIGVNCAWKMQVAIDLCGAGKVIWAAICGGICKIFGKKGVFYDIVGDEIRGLDGFYGNAFAEYENYGILLPKEPKKVCDQLCREYGISAAIVDVNDITCDILGIGWAAPYSAQQLTEIIRDNPSGQSDQQTPFVIIRKNQNPEDISWQNA